MGEGDCAGAYLDPLTSWLESEDTGFPAWTWDAWGSCDNVLISDYTGTPTGYGAACEAILKALP